MSRRPDTRGGFILPTTLLVLALLTVMLTAAFTLVSAEHRATDNAFGGARALSMAEGGLSSYYASNRPVTPGNTRDSVRFTMPGGYVDIVARRLVPAVGNRLSLWAIRATGISTGSVLDGQINGRRTVGQLAELNPGTLPARAAMVAANGVQFLANGGNPLYGADAAFCSPLAADTTALTAFSGGISDSATTGPRPPPSGGPPVVEQFPSWSAVYDTAHIDWTRLLAGDFTPDYVAVPPCLHGMQFSGFPAGLCTGNATLSGTRRGLLVVTGDVLLANGAHWDGILVVGGRLRTPTAGGSAYTVHGMVVTGLNRSQGLSVPPNQLLRGGIDSTRVIQYASCYTRPSVSTLTSFVPLRSGWVGTWAQY